MKVMKHIYIINIYWIHCLQHSEMICDVKYDLGVLQRTIGKYNEAKDQIEYCLHKRFITLIIFFFNLSINYICIIFLYYNHKIYLIFL